MTRRSFMEMVRTIQDLAIDLRLGDRQIDAHEDVSSLAKSGEQPA